MKEWVSPKLWILGAEQTKAGGGGGEGDDVTYEVYGYKLIGTSGDPIDLPIAT